jgi:hypothetical protein
VTQNRCGYASAASGQAARQCALEARSAHWQALVERTVAHCAQLTLLFTPAALLALRASENARSHPWRILVLLALSAAAAAQQSPPCTTFFNPSYETICSTTVVSDGRFSIRDYAAGLNVSLIASTLPVPLTNWTTDTERAAQTVLFYFIGDNSDQQAVQCTTPFIFRPAADAAGEPTISAAMALPTSYFPDPARAPLPEVDAVVEAFPAQRFATAFFQAPTPATEEDFKRACAEAAQWLRGRGIAPAKTGVWAQAWVTYSRLRDPAHVNECWLQVSVPA